MQGKTTLGQDVLLVRMQVKDAFLQHMLQHFVCVQEAVSVSLFFQVQLPLTSQVSSKSQHTRNNFNTCCSVGSRCAQAQPASFDAVSVMPYQVCHEGPSMLPMQRI